MKTIKYDLIQQGNITVVMKIKTADNSKEIKTKEVNRYISDRFYKSYGDTVLGYQAAANLKTKLEQQSVKSLSVYHPEANKYLLV